jgi:hypothetical protein
MLSSWLARWLTRVVAWSHRARGYTVTVWDVPGAWCIRATRRTARLISEVTIHVRGRR